MRFINISFQKIRFAGLIILIAILAIPVSGQVQKEKRVRQMFNVTLKVTDETGAPVPGASVVVGEGVTHLFTDANGSVSLSGYPEDVVTITAFKFEKKSGIVLDLAANPTVILLQGKIHMTSGDIVPLPFTTLRKRNLTGSEVVVDGSYFSHYPSTDLRNSLTGISSMYDVREIDGSPGLSPMEGLQQFSGLSNDYDATDKFNGMPYVIINDMPSELQEMVIGPAEIESATLMKGILSTAMYGPAATGGVLYLKTKTGVPNERTLHFDVETGVSTVDRMPGYVSGAEYARLVNRARYYEGLPAVYTGDEIKAFEKNDGYSLKNPSTDFADMILDNTMEFRRVNMSSSGGNDVVQYYSYLGYAGEGDIIDLGAKSDYNRITARQNVNVKINDYFSAQFGFYGNLTYRRSPNYGYDPDYTTEGTGNATLTLTELPSILDDLHTVPPVAYPIWAYFDESSNTPWYGVSALYTNNLIGNVVDQGYYTDRGRTGASNLKLIYDAGNFVKGLKSETYFGFNIHNTVRVGKTNDYLAYTIKNPDGETLEDRITRYSGHSLFKMADNYKLMDYYFQRWMFYERLSYDKTFANSNLQAAAMYHQTLSYINGIEEPQRQRSWLGTLNYNLMDKYQFQGVLNYAGNSSFAKDYRSMLNWAVGGAYVVTEDLITASNFLNYLKLRVQGGVVGNETYFPNLYDVDRWSSTSTTSTSTPYAFGPYTSNRWFGTTTEAAVTRAYLSRTGNPILTWEKRAEINGGFDAVLFNEKVTLGVTYYNWLVDGSLSQTTSNMPYVAGYNGTRPYQNYNQTRYNALGTDLTFTHKVGNVILTIGANATTSKGKRVKYDEPQYRNDYQIRTGKASDAIFGYQYLGKFATDAEAQGGNNTPVQLFDAELHKDDLKYADLNKDGFVDETDQAVIGYSSPRLYYGINLSLKYKNFDLFVLGAGRALYDLALTNEYFWNGWSDDAPNTYSNFVRDNIGGAYPRLTYYKVNNNFVTSDFWLTKGDFFKIQNVELAYTIPADVLKFMGSRGIRVYIRGANLLTVSGVKDVDPESINSGVEYYPLFRTFSGGVKLNF
ncbi:MAG TPA: SusC/RagA family TonB-linked outer membrane protein [Bacteroidales bacterium]|nr:SusC/RagA family TonB-linked outer membrane protein [Bacteroidales bacterium]HQM68629.1 SusC/RagA family TonB-linked outer membrane protein [Bacteroidales bacterium]